VFSNKALFSQPGEMTLYHTREPATTSVYPPNRDLIRQLAPDDVMLDVVAKETIEATTLDHALRDIEVGELDFLKLDTQGSELDILRGAENVIRGGLFGIEIEVEFAPIYIGQPLFPDVWSFLDKKGFAFVDFPEVVSCSDFRFSRRGLSGYANATELLTAWAGKMKAPRGPWRGAKQLLYADAIFFRETDVYLDVPDEEARRRVTVGVFICCVLRYYEFGLRLIDRATGLNKIDAGLARDLEAMTLRAARSWSGLRGDLVRGLRRLARRLSHPGR
jgi:FkbM family methyltransferase